MRCEYLTYERCDGLYESVDLPQLGSHALLRLAFRVGDPK